MLVIAMISWTKHSTPLITVEVCGYGICSEYERAGAFFFFKRLFDESPHKSIKVLMSVERENTSLRIPERQAQKCGEYVDLRKIYAIAHAVRCAPDQLQQVLI